MTGVLNGIRVLDFGRFIAGPYCATLLADMGADVIRVEKIGGSEDRYVAPVTDEGEGGTFLQLNRNKRGIALDPMTDVGRDVVQRLVRTSDVVVANLPQSTLEAMGIDYPSLTALRSDIVLASVSAFGSKGPSRDRVGFDGVGQMMSGAAHMSGEPDRPVRWAAPYVDFSTALGAAFGVMVALFHRRETGEGQIVEGSLLRSSLTLANSMLIEQAVVCANREPTGNRAYQIGPGDMFRTSDGHWVLVQVIGDRLFTRWARLMGEEERWTGDPRFQSDEDRGQNGEALSERMAAWCSEKTLAEALDALNEARIPAAPVHTPQDVLDDEDIKAAGSFVSMEYPGAPSPVPIVAPISELSVTPATYRAPAPELGRDTQDVLLELGYSMPEIDRFNELGGIQLGISNQRKTNK